VGATFKHEIKAEDKKVAENYAVFRAVPISKAGWGKKKVTRRAISNEGWKGNKNFSSTLLQELRGGWFMRGGGDEGS